MNRIEYVEDKQVLVRAAMELLPGLVAALPLLKSRIRGAWLDAEREGYCVAELVVHRAPAEAAEMNPTFVRFDNGSIGLQSVEWYRKSGTWITTTESI
jgi:hypothetical protein